MTRSLLALLTLTAYYCATFSLAHSHHGPSPMPPAIHRNPQTADGVKPQHPDNNPPVVSPKKPHRHRKHRGKGKKHRPSPRPRPKTADNNRHKGVAAVIPYLEDILNQLPHLRHGPSPRPIYARNDAPEDDLDEDDEDMDNADVDSFEAEMEQSNFGRNSLDYFLKRRLDQEDQAACDLGERKCLVPGSKDSYECIDTQSTLDSCGGCVSEGHGKDCSQLPNVSGAICEYGQCSIYSCTEGYELSLLGEQCIPAR